MMVNPRNKADEATIAMAREHIAFLQDGVKAAHAELDKAGIERETVEWEGVIQHVTEYPVCDRIRFLAERQKPDTRTSEASGDRADGPHGSLQHEPKCVCFAPPTEQHSSYCPREGMDFDPESESSSSTEVDSALKELREMFPKAFVSVGLAGKLTGKEATVWKVEVGTQPSFRGATLAEAMASVRAYKLGMKNSGKAE